MRRRLILAAALAAVLTLAAATFAFGGQRGLIWNNGHFAKPGTLDDGKDLLPQTLRSLLAISAIAVSTPPAFAGGVTNPWFPLKPGTTFVYTGEKDGKRGRDVVTVTHKTKVIRGVRCTAVADRLYLNGRLAERTTDWYAQDARGNVWYFGENTAELNKAGKVTSREGTWQAGVNGAKAGIFMPAHPQVGASFRQEYYKDHAEDHFTVLSLSASVVVPFTASAHALLTKEWTPLEPDTLDHKLYIRGIGLVKEETIKGGDERWELADIRHK
jgi:hypothetical protein